MQKVFDGCRVTAGRSLTKHHTALIVAQCTVFQSLCISNIRRNINICIKNSFYISHAFKPACCLLNCLCSDRWQQRPAYSHSTANQRPTYCTGHEISCYNTVWECAKFHSLEPTPNSVAKKSQTLMLIVYELHVYYYIA